ncbi:MAG: N-acetyltransferase [Alphaproteobacteria bacterium]|nr:MAG: N-acetyltransferase [Alphaproteobacteria bacterium]
MPLDIAPLTGQALADALPELARLRIAVFRDYPYLYDGDEGYESRYLAAYAESPGAVVIAARDGGRIVGMATAAPMEDHAGEFAAPFRSAGHDVGQILYLGESVLLPEWRGRGIGHRFFDLREAHGRALGRRTFAFCAVIRPADHPARPAGYRPLDPFWRKRGYAPVPGLVTTFSWRELGEAEPSPKPMQFWLKRG